MMSDVEVKMKLLNTSRHTWYSASSVVRAFSCQPSSLLPKQGFLFHIPAKNIQVNRWGNLPGTQSIKTQGGGFDWLCYSVFWSISSHFDIPDITISI